MPTPPVCESSGVVRQRPWKIPTKKTFDFGGFEVIPCQYVIGIVLAPVSSHWPGSAAPAGAATPSISAAAAPRHAKAFASRRIPVPLLIPLTSLPRETVPPHDDRRGPAGPRRSVGWVGEPRWAELRVLIG